MSEEVKYTARKIGSIDNGAGYIQGTKVGVFRNDEQIGEYERNYPSYAESTFYAFERDGKWYALYSRHYTGLRLMTLPDCADIGGEEPESHGFCPVELYVPMLTGQHIDPNDPQPIVANHQPEKWAHAVPSEGGGTRYYWPDDKDHPCPDPDKTAAYLKAREESHAAWKAWLGRTPYKTVYAPWGFVAGCYWGDDSSWKLQFLDLSRAPEGVIARDDRFGYLELPGKVSLKNAVSTSRIHVLNAPPEKMTIAIALPTRFDLTGKRQKSAYAYDNEE